MGMDNKDCGSRIVGKEVLLTIMGGIFSSKGVGIQGYHGGWNIPKDLRVLLPGC